MKRTSREVNIFNMSLLDILCGALGAFCFMMLALFPSYIKAQNSSPGDGNPEARAKEAEKRAEKAEAAADKAKAEQSLVYFTINWDTPDDVDLSVKSPAGAFLTVKKDADPSQKAPPSFLHDTEKGPGGETAWFSDIQAPNARWEMYAELHTRAPGSSAPVLVRGYAIARSFAKDGSAIMGHYELGTRALPTPRERVMLGSLQFDAAGQDFTMSGPPSAGGPPAGGPPSGGPPKP